MEYINLWINLCILIHRFTAESYWPISIPLTCVYIVVIGFQVFFFVVSVTFFKSNYLFYFPLIVQKIHQRVCKKPLFSTIKIDVQITIIEQKKKIHLLMKNIKKFMTGIPCAKGKIISAAQIFWYFSHCVGGMSV